MECKSGGKSFLRSSRKLAAGWPDLWGKTRVFIQSIWECQTFKRILAEYGIRREGVTAQNNRDAQLDAFIAGPVQVVTNVSVLSEGFEAVSPAFVSAYFLSFINNMKRFCFYAG